MQISDFSSANTTNQNENIYKQQDKYPDIMAYLFYKIKHYSAVNG